MMTIHSTYTSQFSPFKEWQGQSTTHGAPSNLSEGCCFWHSSANIRTLRRWWVYPCVQSWFFFLLLGYLNISYEFYGGESGEWWFFQWESTGFWMILGYPIFRQREDLIMNTWDLTERRLRDKLFLRFPVDLPSNMWPVEWGSSYDFFWIHEAGTFMEIYGWGMLTVNCIGTGDEDGLR